MGPSGQSMRKPRSKSSGASMVVKTATVPRTGDAWLREGDSAAKPLVDTDRRISNFDTDCLVYVVGDT